MFIFVQIMLAIAAGGVLLTLTSETFADAVSRIFEAALDGVEYRLALRRANRRKVEPQVEGVYAFARAREEF